MPAVIVNADDFGLTEGVTEGIVQAIACGVVTSTTAMACVPGAAERIARWARWVPGRAGAHLQLTSGRPLTDPALTPTLRGADGAFPASKKDLTSARTEEIVLEWDAQFRFLRAAGIEPSHIDTHHHVHKFPNVFAAYCAIARRFDVPARALDAAMRDELRRQGIPCPDRMVLDYYEGDLSAQRLIALLEEASAAADSSTTIEVMCHPGVPCGDLPRLSKYVADRERELETFCRPGFAADLRGRGFMPATYSTLHSSLLRPALS